MYFELCHNPENKTLAIPRAALQLSGLADFVQEGQPAVKAKGINLQIDVVHGKHILLL